MEIIELERWKPSETDPRRPRGETPAQADHWAEYRAQIEDTQNALVALEGRIDPSLDASLVKAIFYALYFGTEGPTDTSAFLNCFLGAANTGSGRTRGNICHEKGETRYGRYH